MKKLTGEGKYISEVELENKYDGNYLLTFKENDIVQSQVLISRGVLNDLKKAINIMIKGNL